MIPLCPTKILHNTLKNHISRIDNDTAKMQENIVAESDRAKLVENEIKQTLIDITYTLHAWFLVI